MSIVRLDGNPRVLAASSADQGSLRSILAAQRPGYDQPDSRTALSLAMGLIRQSNTQLVILHSAITALPALDTNANVQDISLGDPRASNLGISALSATRAADGSVSALIR